MVQILHKSGDKQTLPGQPQSSWSLVYDEFIPEKERQREALCALGNGYFATRGAAPESVAEDIHYPGTYLAGGYNRLKTEIAGRILEHEDLVNLSNWLALTFCINGDEWFDLKQVQILSYRQELNLKQGVLSRQIRFRDAQNRESTLSERRFVHMQQFHLAGLETTLKAENWSGSVTIRSALDGRVTNNGVRGYRFLNKKHLLPLASEVFGENVLYLKAETSQSELRIVQATRTQLFLNGAFVDAVKYRNIEELDYVAQEFSLALSPGDVITIEKIASLYTSRDDAISEAGLAAKTAVIETPGFQELCDSHIDTWEHLWERFDIGLETVKAAPETNPLLILHLHIFHVLQTASPNAIDLDIGLPARGWTGEAYQGHIFWDDLFVFPFLNLRMPDITEALLKYRYKRLDEARKMAREIGLRGARYPWQSGSSGREETPKYFWDPDKTQWMPDHTHMQYHVNSAIAYNVWQYYQVTGDIEFLYTYGAEMILEIARFWASLATYNPDVERYELQGVVGPDEYHVSYPDSKKIGLNNSAYTNIMAVWVLCRALEILEILPADHRNELCQRLEIDKSELELWDTISRKMRLVFHDDGLISQFEGYDNLEDFPWKRDGRIDSEQLKQILKEQGGQVNQYKVSKQADVLMLFYLFSSEELRELFARLGYPFEYETIPKNIHYYLEQTVHGSTLSRVAHAWVLARADRCHAWEILTCFCPPDTSCCPTDQHPKRPRSWGTFLEALVSDFFDIQGGTTPEGIHLGAMAGTVDIIQRCYTGIVVRQDILWLNPRLPEAITSMSFNLHYRNQSLDIEITQDKVSIKALHSIAEKVKIGVKDKIYEFQAGEAKEFQI